MKNCKTTYEAAKEKMDALKKKINIGTIYAVVMCILAIVVSIGRDSYGWDFDESSPVFTTGYRFLWFVGALYIIIGFVNVVREAMDEMDEEGGQDAQKSSKGIDAIAKGTVIFMTPFFLYAVMEGDPSRSRAPWMSSWMF